VTAHQPIPLVRECIRAPVRRISWILIWKLVPPSSFVLTQSLGSGRLYVNGDAEKRGSALSKEIRPIQAEPVDAVRRALAA
jgi:hypothetical protein